MSYQKEKTRQCENIQVPCCPATKTASVLLPDPQAFASNPGNVPLLSPSTKPLLFSQRDHSACGQARQSTPLKVRKTRENLRQADKRPVVPLKDHLTNPHRSGNQDENVAQPLPPANKLLTAETQVSVGASGFSPLPAWRLDGCLPSLPTNNEAAPPREGLQRHRSISKSVLSKVKQGFSVRSRSSQSIRPVESDASLIRKLSGRRHESSGVGQQANSVDLSQISGRESSARSRTEKTSNLRTSELIASFPKPLSNTSTTESIDHSLQDGLRLPDTDTKDYDAHITSNEASIHPNHNATDSISKFVPYISLSINTDTSVVDVSNKQDVWACVEATVTLQQVNSPGITPDRIPPSSKIDAIALFDVSVNDHTADLLEFWCKNAAADLFVAKDRLVAFAVRSRVHHASNSIEFAATQMHPLQEVDMGLMTSSIHQMVSGKYQGWFENDMNVHDLIFAAEAQGLQTTSTHVFVISPTPSYLASELEGIARWPVHQIAIGLALRKDVFFKDQTRCAWAIRDAIHKNVESDNLLVAMSKQIHNGEIDGTIPSLRVCLKPAPDCIIRDIVGHRSHKNLKPGMRYELFVRLRVPDLNNRRQHTNVNDDAQESLFVELESIVGTLTRPILWVEARYKHSLIHQSNTVTIRQAASLRRPKTSSCWSLSSLQDSTSDPTIINGKLAAFIATQRPPILAMRIINHYCDLSLPHMQAVHLVYGVLEKERDAQQSSDMTLETNAPMKVTTIMKQTDTDNISNLEPVYDQMSNSSINSVDPPQSQLLDKSISTIKRTPSHSRSLALENLNASNAEQEPITTNSVVRDSKEHITGSSPSDEKDDARQIWRRMRNSSHTTKQLADMGTEGLRLLEAGDKVLADIRRRALTNKRSVGAETLKGWQLEQPTKGEPPWL